MKFYDCLCGNTLFFENTQCVSCHREVGWCPQCEAIRALEPAGGGDYRCGAEDCAVLLRKCTNYSQMQVCNRCVRVDGEGGAPSYCDYCRFNATIPDLGIPGNREKWARIEAAKRRLLFILDVLGLPYGSAAEGFDPPLAFDFKGDVVPKNRIWRTMGEEEKIYTGHANGRITINILEADDARREQLRVDMGESQRTLVGHFRHEIGHYYWNLLIRGRREEAFKALFGDYAKPSYREALERHYQQGPPRDWQEKHISAYATMHPWEDWAETFAFYLDIASVLETAGNTGLVGAFDWEDFNRLLKHFHRIGIVVNEINRTMGLTDLVPEVITAAVEEKLVFLHQCVREQSRSRRQHGSAN